MRSLVFFPHRRSIFCFNMGPQPHSFCPTLSGLTRGMKVRNLRPIGLGCSGREGRMGPLNVCAKIKKLRYLCICYDTFSTRPLSDQLTVTTHHFPIYHLPSCLNQIQTIHPSTPGWSCHRTTLLCADQTLKTPYHSSAPV